VASVGVRFEPEGGLLEAGGCERKEKKRDGEGKRRRMISLKKEEREKGQGGNTVLLTVEIETSHRSKRRVQHRKKGKQNSEGKKKKKAKLVKIHVAPREKSCHRGLALKRGRRKRMLSSFSRRGGGSRKIASPLGKCICSVRPLERRGSVSEERKKKLVSAKRGKRPNCEKAFLQEGEMQPVPGHQRGRGKMRRNLRTGIGEVCEVAASQK